MLHKLWLVLLPALISVLDPLTAAAQQTPPLSEPVAPQWYGPGPWHMWGGGYGFGGGPFMMMLFFVLVVGLVVFFAARPESRGRHPTRSALEILNERFAKGEIQKQEFEEKRATILRRT